MKVKTFSAISEVGLEKKINKFLSTTYIEVTDIKFTSTLFSLAAMVIYKEK
ncbi:hypothetical protein [Halalkalibacillus halophilus]|uniref:hypothetical protein n=1 Tax=Halalkalibacillus halophilus TaxID=392827 RepID=UPI0004250F36|nr:hypothetical protein [Halalkalibacillus halophilus]